MAISVVGVDLSKSVIQISLADSQRVWCKYSNKPYDMVIKQYYR